MRTILENLSQKLWLRAAIVLGIITIVIGYFALPQLHSDGTLLVVAYYLGMFAPALAIAGVVGFLAWDFSYAVGAAVFGTLATLLLILS